ncbi:MAG: DMT family transporter [Patescibacteria group bacterium]
MGAGSLLFMAFLYGWFGILIRFVSQSGIPAFYQICIRSFATSAILILILLISKGKIKIPSLVHIPKYLFRSLFGFVSFSLSYYAFINLPISVAYFFFYGGFLIGGFLLGIFLYKEKLNTTKLISCLLAFIGIVVVFSKQENVIISGLYIFMAFASGLFSVLWSSMPKLLPSDYIDLESNLFDTISVLIFAILTTFLLREKISFPKDSFSWFMQIAFVAQAVINGQLMITGFQNIDSQVGAVIMLLEIVFAGIFSYFIFSEIPSSYTLVGSLFIIFASALPVIVKLNSHKPKLIDAAKS